MAEQRVKLTFPSYGTGSTDIFARGKRVGFTLGEFKGWRAYLFPKATDRRIREGGEEEVTGRTLGELRRVLRERVELKGAWWTA